MKQGIQPRLIVGGQPGYVVLASGFGDEDTGGGLFAFDGCVLERLDYLSSTGLSLAETRLLRLLRSVVEVDRCGELLVYDAGGLERYYRLDGVVDPHDICWDGQHFIVVSTSTNRVLWIAPSGDIVRQWHAPGEGDCWHLNSLLLHKGELFVSAFGLYHGHREWAHDTTAGAGFVLNLATGQIPLTGLSHPHSPRWMDGAWVVCNSSQHQVLLIDAVTGTLQHMLQLKGYTRGLAIGDDAIFIGESANRADSTVHPSGATASIVVACRKTWTIVDRVPLPCREVYDLLLAPYALVDGVRRGSRTNSQRVAEQDQYTLFREVGVEPLRLWATGDPLPPEACRVNLQADIPVHLEVGAAVELACVVENVGTAALVSAPPYPVSLSYRWVPCGADERLEGPRFRLPRALYPRQSFACTITVTAPPMAGAFLLCLTLVQEHIAWFDEVDTANGCQRLVRIVPPESSAQGLRRLRSIIHVLWPGTSR
jgi:hypothetical protein